MIAYTNDYGVLLAGDRQTYRLADRLGEGGEGVVYMVEDRPDLAAKVYKEFDFLKEEKLEHLTKIATKRLLRAAAWPLSTLRDAENRVVGFVMPRLDGWQPLHGVYSVRQRLQLYPDRTWQFLIRTARNLAACVHHVHDAGLVVGDLNESNVLVDHRAMVKLIDVDSFQARVGDRLHGCHVGRPELLAPELQGRSLADVERTPEHDRFALAILIFQLLAFGRHPFAGRQDDDEERSLESSIQQGHYAFSKLRPGPLKPPKLAELDYLPEEILLLFERAFDPTTPERPSGVEWFRVLHALEGNLVGCPENGNHRFWTGCTECPWCHVEEKGGISLFPAKLSPAELKIDADDLWQGIQPMIRRFNSLPEPAWVNYQTLEPAPMTFLERASASWATSFAGNFILIQAAIQFSRMIRGKDAWLISIPVVLFVLLGAVLAIPQYKHRKRQKKLNKAIRSQADLELQFDSTASDKVFEAHVHELQDRKDFLTNYGESTEKARQKMVRTKYKRQLEAFLKKYSTLAADIGQFGRDQMATLYDRGVQTALDVTEEKLGKQPLGYANVVRGLFKWREALEEQFWATGSFHLSLVEEQRVQQQLRKEAAEAKRVLKDAPERLEDLMLDIQVRRAEISEQMEQYRQTILEVGPHVLAFENVGKKKEEKVPAR